MASFKRAAALSPRLSQRSKALRIGQYEVNRIRENLLGKGGFGVVWKGTDVYTQKTVAVKILDKHRIRDKYVERELDVMRSCDHENIVKLYNCVKDDTSVYIIMEYCDCNDLDHFMRYRDLPFAPCLRIMQDSAAAIKYLHEEKKIIHRDIKAENILVHSGVTGLSIKITDFGLSRFVSRLSSLNAATGKMGTVLWMAPEIKQNKRICGYSMAVDIFSLGMVFLAILMHQPRERLSPFTGMHDDYFCIFDHKRSSLSLFKCYVMLFVSSSADKRLPLDLIALLFVFS